MPEPVIQLRGLREVTNAFRRVDKEIPRGFRGAFLPIAQRVVNAIQQIVPFVSGRAARSVTARASQRGAAISFGGASAPHFTWLDFGGSVGVGHVPGQAWSGSVKRPWAGRPLGSGRYVYPTIEDQSDEIRAAAEDAVLSVARAAGFEVH